MIYKRNRMNISVFGLGYVGVVTSACLAKMGHNIVGVDIVDYKVSYINQGLSPIEEKGLNEMIHKARWKDRSYFN